jgi:hypothetical protein
MKCKVYIAIQINLPWIWHSNFKYNYNENALLRAFYNKFKFMSKHFLLFLRSMNNGMKSVTRGIKIQLFVGLLHFLHVGTTTLFFRVFNHSYNITVTQHYHNLMINFVQSTWSPAEILISSSKRHVSISQFSSAETSSDPPSGMFSFWQGSKKKIFHIHV